MAFLIKTFQEFLSNCQELSNHDQIYLSEIREILETLTPNPLEIYKELTYLYVRYTNTTVHYRHISPFQEENLESPVLNVISYFRVISAQNVFDLYRKILNESQKIIVSTIKNKNPICGNLVFLLKNFGFQENLSEETAEMEMSLCEVCEYLSYVNKFFENCKISNEDLEYLLAVSIYFGYFDKEDTEKWEESSNFIVKIFNKYTNDGLRKDSYFNMNGIHLYELFKMNEIILRKHIRDINLWALAGYRYRLDMMSKELEDIKESIDREEFSVTNLNKCKENLIEAKNIHNAYQFYMWNVNSMNLRQVRKIIALNILYINDIETLKE